MDSRQLLLATAVLLVSGRGVAGAEPRVLDLGTMPDDEELANLLWERAPELVAARARLAQAQAEVERARRLPNPVLDASWSTIPLGTTNPPGLESPLTNVPAYQFGLSAPFELGKRGPRRSATEKQAHAAGLDAAETLRRLHLDLLSATARVASSEQRIAWLTDQAADAARLTTLAAQRASHGDVARLDEDRARIDEAKLRNLFLAERHRLSEALLECGRLAGVRCEPFASVTKTQAALSRLAQVPSETVVRGVLGSRPDLLSLAAQEEGYAAAATLARARRIPDPSLRLGYTLDQFQTSGNQRHSFGVGMILPLPLFERGQADLAQALAARNAAATERRLLAEQATRDLDRLFAQAQELAERQRAMREEYLPLARNLVERLTATVRAGGAPLPDLLLARRNLNELLSDASELDLLVVENALAIRRQSGAQQLLAPPANRMRAPSP
jgi:cobalt-zinc-cadmium efflux system outer membrane protein